jgi:parallel beta-helix repeat protein
MHSNEVHNLYVSTTGKDSWSGTVADPDADGRDGPLATIEAARDRIRDWKQTGALTGPVTVLIRGGRYPIQEPLLFTPEDSAPITYAAYPGERPVLDGGERIEGWREERNGSNRLWVTDLPDVASGRWYFRQLWVNGERRQRARLPRKGYYRIEHVPGMDLEGGTFVDQLFDGSDRFVAAPGNIQLWRHLSDVEVIVLHYWIEERMPIASFDESTRLVRSTRTSMFALRDDVASTFARYYVENVFEALSEPGDWYLDRETGRLSYIPLDGEELPATQISAARTEQLLRIDGHPQSSRYVEFLRFTGLTFRHGDWSQPERMGDLFAGLDDKGVQFAAAPQAACNVPGAVALRGARYCAIDDCTIEHVGLYGVELSDGCVANRVEGNHLHDLGAGGIKVNGSDATGAISRRTGSNRITDNHIHGCGRVFHSAVGIFSAHSSSNDISHNHIHDLYYSGISCGWVWGYGDNVSRENRIEYNHIHDIGHGLLSDMGGIYTLGIQPGTVIRGNRIYNVEKRNYGGWGIYLDEGSSHILVEDNICFNTSSQGFNQHYGRENIVRNNIFAFGREGQVSLTRREHHNSFTVLGNILLMDDQLAFVGRRVSGLEERGFRSDLNLLWDVGERQPVSGNGAPDEQANWIVGTTFPLQAWRDLGQDRHSLVADPLCRSLGTFDFILEEDSPAFALGFRQIDHPVGPRDRARHPK